MKHTLHIFGILVILLWSSQMCFAQGKGYKIDKRQKNRPEAYPNPYDFRPTGWIFEGGVTGTFGIMGDQSITTGDSTFTSSTSFRPMVALNVGRYFSVKKGHKLVKYVDATLGYKSLWNTEEQQLVVASQNIDVTNTHNNTAHYASLNLNLNNIISLDNYTFIQNTIGVNADYRFAQNVNAANPYNSVVPSSFVVQVHYKLALGLMIDNDKAVIPYIEIPVFNITPTQTEFSQLDYFDQSYQSVIVGVRLMLFRLGQKDCPKAINYQGNPNQQNGY